jgi:NADH dehydrogenase/NADH:ubiquinone oxidoreductase subunit G
MLFHDIVEDIIRYHQMAYYKNEEYRSEAEMKRQGMSEADKAAQRELNWDIRIEHYAKNSQDLKNCAQFRKMVDNWAESFDFPSPGVPTLKMLHILKLARENGIRSETISQFARAEEDLLAERPGFVSPAAVPFNTEKKNKLCIAAMKARVERREKKAAAVLARAAGKVAAAEKRAADQAAWDEATKKGREAIEKAVAGARKAMGVRKNEPNPASICALISKWEFELSVDLYAQRMSK